MELLNFSAGKSGSFLLGYFFLQTPVQNNFYNYFFFSNKNLNIPSYNRPLRSFLKDCSGNSG